MPAVVQLPFHTLNAQRVPAITREIGACVSVKNPDIFFSEIPAEITQAKAICAGCPVAATCHSYAAQNEIHGVWGNTTPAERAAAVGMPILSPEQRREAASIQEAILSGMTVREVAAKYSCTERTVYRYKRKMRDAGILAA